MKKVGFFRSIQFKFILIYILLLLVAVQVIGSYFVREIEDELFENFYGSVDDRVYLLNHNLEQAFNRERDEDSDELTLEEEVQKIVADIDTATITSLQVIDSQSRVIGTNDYLNREVIGKKISGDIVQKALLGDEQENITINEQTEERLYLKTNPIYNEDKNVVGVIYVEASLNSVYGQLQNINKIFLQGSLLAITVSAFLGILVARAITRPIKEMRRQAETMAKGDFSQKVDVYGTDEISQLAETFNDLNDRLKHSIASTEEEQRKLQSVLANMSEGVVATDTEGKITLMNEAAENLLGKSRSKITDEFLFDSLRLEDKVVDITELQESGSMIIDLSDDEPLLVRATFSMVLDESGQVHGIITVLMDATEQEKIEKERREFVSNVSHELRTPLTAMRSYLEALTDGAWKDEEIAPRFLKVTQNETERMIRLVNDLLQLSHMDQKQYILQRERTEFITYVHHIIDRFEMNITEGITFKRNLPKGKHFVWIDKDKMTQVLDNIISNAVKYSPEGGKIEFIVTHQNRQLYIKITDEGIGIPHDMHDKIFERFYRADKARTRKLGGSGLGLAITKDLVEAHYGEIWVDDTKKGKGTTIIFTLPLMNQKRGLQP